MLYWNYMLLQVQVEAWHKWQQSNTKKWLPPCRGIAYVGIISMPELHVSILLLSYWNTWKTAVVSISRWIQFRFLLTTGPINNQLLVDFIFSGVESKVFFKHLNATHISAIFFFFFFSISKVSLLLWTSSSPTDWVPPCSTSTGTPLFHHCWAGRWEGRGITGKPLDQIPPSTWWWY